MRCQPKNDKNFLNTRVVLGVLLTLVVIIGSAFHSGIDIAAAAEVPRVFTTSIENMADGASPVVVRFDFELGPGIDIDQNGVSAGHTVYVEFDQQLKVVPGEGLSIYESGREVATVAFEMQSNGVSRAKIVFTDFVNEQENTIGYGKFTLALKNWNIGPQTISLQTTVSAGSQAPITTQHLVVVNSERGVGSALYRTEPTKNGLFSDPNTQENIRWQIYGGVGDGPGSKLTITDARPSAEQWIFECPVPNRRLNVSLLGLDTATIPIQGNELWNTFIHDYSCTETEMSLTFVDVPTDRIVYVTMNAKALPGESGVTRTFLNNATVARDGFELPIRSQVIQDFTGGASGLQTPPTPRLIPAECNSDGTSRRGSLEAMSNGFELTTTQDGESATMIAIAKPGVTMNEVLRPGWVRMSENAASYTVEVPIKSGETCKVSAQVPLKDVLRTHRRVQTSRSYDTEEMGLEVAEQEQELEQDQELELEQVQGQTQEKEEPLGQDQATAKSRMAVQLQSLPSDLTPASVSNVSVTVEPVKQNTRELASTGVQRNWEHLSCCLVLLLLGGISLASIKVGASPRPRLREGGQDEAPA